MRQFTALTLVALIAGSLAGCGEPAPTSTSTKAPGTPPAWLLATEPAGALSVADAKADATEGETIVVRGRIGGRKAPISADSPVFVIVDLSLPHCGEDPDDKCPTPWDYCCEPKSDLAARSATVQIVDAEGNTAPRSATRSSRSTKCSSSAPSARARTRTCSPSARPGSTASAADPRRVNLEPGPACPALGASAPRGTPPAHRGIPRASSQGSPPTAARR